MNCQRLCGNVTVPFPFGLEEGCSARKLFQLKCTNATSSTLQFDDEHLVTVINVIDGLVAINYTSYYEQPMFREHELKEHGLYIGSLVSSSVQWVVANLTCQEAKMNSSGYACVSVRSACLGVNSSDGGYIGYRCKCMPGFLGNPYISNGCQGSLYLSVDVIYPNQVRSNHSDSTIDCTLQSTHRNNNSRYSDRSSSVLLSLIFNNRDIYVLILGALCPNS